MTTPLENLHLRILELEMLVGVMDDVPPEVLPHMVGVLEVIVPRLRDAYVVLAENKF